METNKRIFEAYSVAELEELERVRIWASIWASVSREFTRLYSLLYFVRLESGGSLGFSVQSCLLAAEVLVYVFDCLYQFFFWTPCPPCCNLHLMLCLDFTIWIAEFSNFFKKYLLSSINFENYMQLSSYFRGPLLFSVLAWHELYIMPYLNQ